MDKQDIKVLFILVLVIFYSNVIFCQKDKIPASPLIIISDISKPCYYPGDTINFTIKNVSGNNRGYTVEAICTSGSESIRSFNQEKYTAYFNNDTTFLMSLKKQEKESGKIDYLLQSAKVNPHDITANSSSVFLFILRGKQSKNGVEMKFRIEPDIVEGEPEFVIETRPFRLYVRP